MKYSNSLASREATIECTALGLSSRISAKNEIRFIYLTCHGFSARWDGDVTMPNFNHLKCILSLNTYIFIRKHTHIHEHI